MIFLGATIRERLAVLETKVDNIQEELVDMKDNHLATIEKKLEKIEKVRTWRPKDYVALGSSLSAFAVAILAIIFG